MFTKNRQDMPQADELIYADATTRRKKYDPAFRRLMTMVAIALVSTVAVVTTVLTLGHSIQNREARYLHAQDLLMQGAHRAAMTEFEALGDYRDSQEQLAHLTAQWQAYQEALDLLEDAANDQIRTDPMIQYDAAAALLEGLGEFEDARQWLDRCYTAAASIMLERGNQDAAQAYIGNMSPETAAAFCQEQGLEIP